MIIRNKFNGYGFDGSRLCHDPVSLSIAATQAGAASSAAAAALAAKTAAATTAATTAATAAAGKTAALELAKQQAISAGMKQAGMEATKQVGLEATKQVGTEVAKQGLAQAGQQTGVEAMKQGIFSNPAGMPPTAGGPITPAGPINPAAPLNPAGQSAGINQANTSVGPNTISDVPIQNGPIKILDAKPGMSLEEAQALNNQLANAPANPYLNTRVELNPAQFDASSLANTAGPESSLTKGAREALEWVGNNKLETGLGLMTAGQYMNEPEKEDKDKYKNKVDMSEFQPTIPSQPSFTPSYQYQSYAVGGPVEQMSAQNAVGSNTGYPMAGLQTPVYSNPAMQRPEATNVIAPSADYGVGTFSGEPRFAEGGLSEAERREYGLSTRSQRASRNLTKSYEEMEEQRQKEAMKLFGERSDPGIIRRSRTQELSSPFSAALAEHARLGKKSKVPVVEMPKTNLGDIDNYMDIPIEAAGGGIMHGAQRYAKGGTPNPTTRNLGGSSDPNYFRREAAGGRNPNYAKTKAPVVSLPEYSAPVQQTPYTPISYQDDLSYQMPQPQQQPDMSGFYNSLNQQLGNYGFAAGGGIMSGAHLGGYSDGGRLLKGPGDGVSDSIPAVIGKRQPARLADGEFVVPARIVSELGNGSTEAGARKLYAMMERVQNSRKKSIGKKKVAVNSKADKHLPA